MDDYPVGQRRADLVTAIALVSMWERELRQHILHLADLNSPAAFKKSRTYARVHDVALAVQAVYLSCGLQHELEMAPAVAALARVTNHVIDSSVSNALEPCNDKAAAMSDAWSSLKQSSGDNYIQRRARLRRDMDGTFHELHRMLIALNSVSERFDDSTWA